jgi:[ribosomal protein S18]-alanine N-acetyltransferase
MSAQENRPFLVRHIRPSDVEFLHLFLNSSIHLHQHLDWHTPLDRLSFRPFLLAEKNEKIIAAFCSPIIEEKVSWIQLFAAKKMLSLSKVWQALFEEYIHFCIKKKMYIQILTLAYYPWFSRLLENSGFVSNNAIVTLENDGLYPSMLRYPTPGYHLEPITIKNFHLVHELDLLAFDLPWQMTVSALKKAYRSSIYATLILDDNKVIGYQITTEGDQSLHLARIAVHPAYRNQGIGTYLTFDLLNFMKRANFHNLSVNTQRDNETSLALYQKMGFYKTGNDIPVMVYNMKD